MKVLFLTNIPAPYRIDFFNELGKKCDLTVLYERQNALDREEKWTGNKSDKFKEIFLNGITIGTDASLTLKVLKYLKDKTYDIIVIGGYSTPTGMLAIEYLKFTKRKFLLNIDGGMIKSESRMNFKIKKHFISSASAWLSTGDESNKYLKYYGARNVDIYKYPFTSIKEKEISNILKTKEEKVKLRNKLGIKEEKIIISVGQFIHRKGFDSLIEAMRYLPKNYGLYIIGGEATVEYMELKKKYQLDNIHFMGFKTKTQLTEFYEAGDLFILPTREDIWGLVINEAMACGLPVITTDRCIAGLELIEDNKNGFIVPVDNIEVMVEKIVEIMDDGELCKKMTMNNIGKIKKYTIETMAVKHMEIFNCIYGGF